MPSLLRYLACYLCLLQPVLAADHGVILLYHHVDTDTPASTSISPADFSAHLRYIEEQGFKVLPLSRLLEDLKDGDAPDNAIAITFDDAYISVFQTAYPLLKKRGWPFTLFINAQSVDQGQALQMNWDQLREMANNGAAISNHSLTHAHLVRRLDGETEKQWLQRIRDEVVVNEQRLDQELPNRAEADKHLFAYPFGEYDEALLNLLDQLDYASIGQQSGAAASPPQQLIPRFPLAGSWAGLDRLKTALNSQPLPVVKADGGTIISTPQNASDTLTLVLKEGFNRQSIACYSARGDRLTVELTGKDSVQVALPRFTAGRQKVNCTAPVSGESGSYYWYSQQWLIQTDKGEWYSE